MVGEELATNVDPECSDLDKYQTPPDIPSDVIPKYFAITHGDDVGVRITGVDDYHALREDTGLVLELTSIRHEGCGCSSKGAPYASHHSRVHRK